MPWSSKAFALGFGYPLREPLAELSLGRSFIPQHSWALPFKAFVLCGDRILLSENPFARALANKTLEASKVSFNDLIPPQKLFPSMLPKVLIRDGAVCFPGLLIFRAFSPLNVKAKRLPSLYPLTLFHQHSLTQVPLRSLRVFHPVAWHFPRGAPARLTFFTYLSHPTSLRIQPVADYFFISKRRDHLRNPSTCLSNCQTLSKREAGHREVSQ